ncbi:ABC transporter, ATP-binding protein [Collinsella intestinalis DSM 13280]|uniref:Fatty acid ABC transporter ATP-binding/permease protein n=1 Tax=Collinsella intestinalis DSM 13280 TaxID=521003 RepID=C4FAT9_9ACTN|nr:ABC transporter ATP-binding protein [Collinsella intestinalis]EEP44082.1 ABC transporter, ATP-binding protein [Collinsella intestinalis DSM 13280]
MAWDKKKRDDGSDELFSENARLERERKQGAIDDAQAMADASGTPEEELEVPKDTWGTVRRLWHAAAGERWRFGVVIAAILVYTGFHVAAPAYSARVIDVLWTNIQAAFAEGRAFTVGWETGGRELATYFGIWTGACALYSVQCFVMAGFAEKLNLSLRRSIAEKLSRLPLKFYDGHKPGEVVSRATNDLDKMSEVLQTGLLKLMSAVGTIIGALYMMLRYSVLLTAIFLVFAFVSTLITKGVSKWTLKLAAERQRYVGELTATVEEAYSGRLIIKSFNREGSSSQRVHELSDKLARASRRADFATNAISPLIRFIIRLAQVLIAVVAGSMLVGGQITIGVFQAFFQYIHQASEPLTQLSFTINTLQNALASVERVFDILDEEEVEPDPLPEVAARLPAAVEGRVDFSRVRFGYNPEKPLMRDVTFHVKPGQKVAIVGATGAGKTTLINLLMRFYEIGGGSIELDGVDTHAMARPDLRANFGMVLQDAWLFDGTIAENIAYGRPDATREEIVRAAEMAHVDHFVRTMPQGYDTHIENDAETISQGQRQLLTIARVILCNPAILILDEATSSVDTRTERDIVQAMETLMHGRTSFVIAHRLSTIVDADLILHMRAGTIIEQGTHEELLVENGPYADLYRSQFA